MELTYNELKKREVINVVDGKSLGKIIDMTLIFPEGKLIGITVPGRNQNCISKIFEKSRVYIPRKNIKKIGGDVILVHIDCGGVCDSSSEILPSKKQENHANPCHPSSCQPPLPPHEPPCLDTDFDRLDLSDY